jgi:Ca2+-binding EF-hand superfamily protein
VKKTIWLATLMLLPCAALAEAKPKSSTGPQPGISMGEFSRIDANHDGSITLEEAKKAGARLLVKNFNEIDTNHTGKLLRQEINDFILKRREEAVRQTKEMDEKNFRQVDANHDGSISIAEAEKAPAPLLAKNFAMIDTDNDGKLSQQEVSIFLRVLRGQMARRIMAADKKVFQRIDTDHNGSISREEATKTSAPLLAANFDAIDLNRDGKLSLQEVGAFWQMRRQAILRLMAADKNHDGALSKDEVKGFPKLSADFEKIDADHNGQLSMQEIKNYYQSVSAGKKKVAVAK